MALLSNNHVPRANHAVLDVAHSLPLRSHTQSNLRIVGSVEFVEDVNKIDVPAHLSIMHSVISAY